MTHTIPNVQQSGRSVPACLPYLKNISYPPKIVINK